MRFDDQHKLALATPVARQVVKDSSKSIKGIAPVANMRYNPFAGLQSGNLIDSFTEETGRRNRFHKRPASPHIDLVLILNTLSPTFMCKLNKGWRLITAHSAKRWRL